MKMQNEKVCPICGKIFYGLNGSWAYHKGNQYMCSWTCFNKCKGQKGKRGRPADTPEQKKRNTKIYADYKSGMGIWDIAKKYNITHGWIRAIIKQKEKQDGNSDNANLS